MSLYLSSVASVTKTALSMCKVVVIYSLQQSMGLTLYQLSHRNVVLGSKFYRLTLFVNHFLDSENKTIHSFY